MVKLFSSEESFFPPTVAGWKTRCAEYFPYSTYFEGKRSGMYNTAYKHMLTNPENGSASQAGVSADTIASNGKLEAFKNLAIST